MFRQVLQALAHIHAHNVLHRDIKLTNILVGANGSPVLCDFGVSKMHEGQTVAAMPAAVTTAVQASMTPEYAAPEVLQRQVQLLLDRPHACPHHVPPLAWLTRPSLAHGLRVSRCRPSAERRQSRRLRCGRVPLAGRWQVQVQVRLQQ